MKWLTIVVLLSLPCSAVTVFVSQSGGSVSCGVDGTQSTTAVGSVTYSAGNTYKYCGTITSTVTMNSSGTAGSEIILDGSDGTFNAPISLTGASYWFIQNVTWATTFQSASAAISMEGTDTNGTIQNNTIDISNPAGTDSNSARMIWLGPGTHDILIKNNFLRNAATTNPLQVDIMDTSGSYNVIVQGNYFETRVQDDATCASTQNCHNDQIQTWGTTYNWSVRYNKFVMNCTSCANNRSYMMLQGSGTGYFDVYSNVFVGIHGASSANGISWNCNTGTDCRLYGNTFLSKTDGPNNVVAIVQQGGTVTISNNIVEVTNTSAYNSSGTITRSNNLWFNAGTGNIPSCNGTELCGSDPLFTNVATNDLTLQSGSPARTAGINIGASYNQAIANAATWPNPTLITRSPDTTWDIGAYQYPPASGQAYILVSSGRITVTTGKITVSAGAAGISPYNGVDVIQWGTVPNLGGLTDNGATVYDTSMLGHKMWDGSTYTGVLSPVTRVTDSVSAPGRQYKSYVAGQGGSGVFTLTNTDTTIVGLNETSFERLCIFNNALAPGRCLPASSYTTAGSTSAQPVSGIVLTTNMNNAGGGSSSTPVDFGSIQFSSTDRTLHYVFGSNSHLTAPLTVTPVTISLTPSTLGIYTIGSTLVDFTFGFPGGAPEWQTAHAYANGAYVTHTLTTGEMATSGSWTALTTYNLGDIVTSGGAGSGNCMYRVIAVVSGSSGTSGSTSPTFDTTAPCANDTLPSGTTFDGSVRWRGTNSLAKFLYQNTGANCTSGASFTISGHPDLLSTVSDGAGGCTSWQSMGPSYVPIQDSMLWNAIGGVSNDTANGGFASKFAEATSTDSYGGPTATADTTRYKNYAAGQGTGIWIHYYDATANSYHLLNTATGIWTKTTCTGGTGYNCSGGTIAWSTVGTLTTISNNPTIGHACGFATHNSKLDPTGSYVEVQEQVFFDTTCNSLNNSLMWKPQAAFNASTSLQYVFGGTNHWCLTPTKMVAFNGNSFSQTSGVFITQYDITNVSSSPVYSVYLQNFPNQTCAQVYNPPGSYVTAAGVIKSPDANIAEAVDSHLSCAAPSSGYACGTTYNYGTLSPIAFNAWQNMETCYPLGTTASSVSTAATCTSTPLTSIGPVKQYTHTFATGTNTLFSSQFQISEYSQDGKWLLWSSDWNCSLGSLDGSVPVVNADGFLGHLPVSPVPASPGSFCGLPWQASHAYVVGNMINPIENTSGSGGVDDVYQAVAVNGMGTSGPPSSLSNNQPKCGTTSCWIQTTAPTASTAGTYVCDSSDGLSNLVSATLPTCTNGIIWQDVGPQTSRGDVFAVRLSN